MGLIAMWIVITILVFIGSMLILDDRTAYFEEDWHRRAIGAVGLAAPLWPISAVLMLLVAIFYVGRYLLRVVRGRE